jgi:hypothetical protein
MVCGTVILWLLKIVETMKNRRFCFSTLVPEFTGSKENYFDLIRSCQCHDHSTAKFEKQNSDYIEYECDHSIGKEVNIAEMRNGCLNWSQALSKHLEVGAENGTRLQPHVD